MNSIARIKGWKAAGMLVIVGMPACTLTSTLGRSTRALQDTAQAMDRTREVLQQSQRAMANLGTSLGALSHLQTLEKPLQNLGTLGPDVERLGTRLQGVETSLQRLDEPLANVAALAGPLENIHTLDKPLQTIANLERHTDKLGLKLLAGLALWMFMTFVAAYGAFVTALRRYPRYSRTTLERRGVRRKPK